MATFEDYIVRRTVRPDGQRSETWQTMIKCRECRHADIEKWADGPRYFCTAWQEYAQSNGWCYMARMTEQEKE